MKDMNSCVWGVQPWQTIHVDEALIRTNGQTGRLLKEAGENSEGSKNSALELWAWH